MDDGDSSNIRYSHVGRYEVGGIEQLISYGDIEVHLIHVQLPMARLHRGRARLCALKEDNQKTAHSCMLNRHDLRCVPFQL